MKIYWMDLIEINYICQEALEWVLIKKNIENRTDM